MPTLIWLIVAFVVGVLVEWLLEIFFLRRSMFEQRAAVDKLRADLNTCMSVRANLEKENSSLKTRTKQLTGDLDNAVKAKAMLEGNLKAREADLTKLHAEVDGHLTQNKNLTADVAKFTAGAATATATIKALEGNKAGLEKQVADLQAQLDKAHADLNASVNAKAGTDKQLADLQAQLDKAHADLNASVQSRNTLEGNLKAREADLAKLHAEVDGHLAQNKNLTADVAKFTAGAATATATIKALEGSKAGLEKQVADLRDQLDACASTRARLEADLKSREAKIEKLRVPTTPAPVPVTPVPVAPVPATPAPSAEAQFARMRARKEDDETPFETACPQHLSDVKGIGTVFESRLYQAGVGTYWELSQLSNADLKRILELSALQANRLNLTAIRAHARKMARETKSLGRKWTQSEPDDFEPMEGIGHTFEKRLYDAGICTYESLASASVQLLEAICHAPAQVKPDYAAWIKQAKSLAAKKAKREHKA
ncbi:MAG TPA: hypothetical protein VF932_02080 [Anaerolineae bacterium]